jgi:hypothetical protein
MLEDRVVNTIVKNHEISPLLAAQTVITVAMRNKCVKESKHPSGEKRVHMCTWLRKEKDYSNQRSSHIRSHNMCTCTHALPRQ